MLCYPMYDNMEYELRLSISKNFNDQEVCKLLEKRNKIDYIKIWMTYQDSHLHLDSQFKVR